MTSSLVSLSGSLGSPSSVSTPGSPVAQTDKAGLARVATDLTIDASVVIALGGSASEGLTYNAAGLLDTLARAGTAPEPVDMPAGVGSATLVRQAADEAIVGTLTAASTAAGVYTATGAFQGLSSATLSSSWATILQSNPELAGTVVASSLAQGITRTLIASV